MKDLKYKTQNLKWCLLQLFLFAATINGFSQATVYTRYFVAFTDKNASPYSVSNPQQYLSQRAINRRNNQHISITNQDLPVNPSYVQQVQSTGAIVVSYSRWFNGVIVKITNQSQIASINALTCVSSNKPLARVKASEKLIPTAQTISSNQKTSSTQSNRFNYGQSQGQIYLLNGECLHNQGYDGTGMQIGIIDNGFINSIGAPVFDTLWQNHQVIASHDFFTNDSLVYNEGGHGTEVLSCIAANYPGQMMGTAPYAKFYLLRSELDTTEKIVEEYQWVSAIEYADSAGADVVNSSLGYTTFDDASQSHTWADLNGRTSVASISATMAARRGMIVCIAAGNEGGSSWQKISVPADADSILAVGSVNGSGVYSFFSSTGNTADGRIKPDVAAQGETTCIANSSGIFTGNGTSFASPTMAGMVACLWQGNPTQTNMQVIAAIKQSATQYASPDSLLGYGIPDFCVADQILKGTSPTFGIHSLTSNLINTLCGSTDCVLTVSLYDVAGRMILSSETKSSQNNTTDKIIQSLDLSGVSTGMYVVKISSANGNMYTRKLVKQ